jgi:hypothetical protein
VSVMLTSSRSFIKHKAVSHRTVERRRRLHARCSLKSQSVKARWPGSST